MNYYPLIIPLLIGWLSGWLVNYLADVLPVTRSFSQPTCPHCHKPLAWGDYLLLRKCASCGQRRSVRTFLVQAVLTLAPVWMWLFPRAGFPFAQAALLFIFLSLVFVIDVEHRLILHPISLVGGLLGLGIGILLHGPINTIIGGALGFGVMLLFYYLGEAYVRYMSKRRGMATDEVALGFGDVNLAGILGLLIGWPYVVIGLVVAVVAGGVVSIVMIGAMLVAKKFKAFTAIPYAPFLVLSIVYFLYFYRY